jgi:hypothetical protein
MRAFATTSRRLADSISPASQRDLAEKLLALAGEDAVAAGAMLASVS